MVGFDTGGNASRSARTGAQSRLSARSPAVECVSRTPHASPHRPRRQSRYTTCQKGASASVAGGGPPSGAHASGGVLSRRRSGTSAPYSASSVSASTQWRSSHRTSRAPSASGPSKNPISHRCQIAPIASRASPAASSKSSPPSSSAASVASRATRHRALGTASSSRAAPSRIVHRLSISPHSAALTGADTTSIALMFFIPSSQTQRGAAHFTMTRETHASYDRRGDLRSTVLKTPPASRYRLSQVIT